MNVFENKKLVTVYSPAKESPLNYSDLLVFCYRQSQSRFDTIPTVRRTAKSTGLREATVASSTKRLQEFGLLIEDDLVIKPCPHLKWFHKLGSLEERFPDGPEFLWLQNWKCFVRSPGSTNPLTVPCVMLYSLIYHSVITKWKPNNGWTLEYLALATATNTKTVNKSLECLEQNGFLEVLDGLRFKLFRLRESQLASFSDKGVWSANSAEPDEICDEFSSAGDSLQQSHESLQALRAFVNSWHFEEHNKDWIIRKTTSHENWESNWKENVDIYTNKLLAAGK